MSNETITAIIPNWNGKRFLAACIDSLMLQEYPDLDIIVVDNASTDGSADFLAAAYPHVRVEHADKNLGFGGGCNLGIKKTNSPYILLLNNDAVLLPGCLAALKLAMDQNRKVGSCATRISLESMPGLLDAAGIAICADGLAIGRGRMEPAERYNMQSDVFFASGCCGLYRKALFDDIGLFDEDFFAYAEDTDLGWRAQSQGWRSVYVPEALVDHRHSGTTGSVSRFKAYLVERNRICVAIKNFPLPLLIYGMWYTIRRYAWQTYGALFSRGRAGDFTTQHSVFWLGIILLRAWIGAFRMLPVMLKKRRQIREKTVITPSVYQIILKKFGVSARDIALRS